MTTLTLAIADSGPFAGGAAFGDAGAYEWLRGRARFAVDPEAPEHRAVVDLDRAPRNAAGGVEFAADVYLLRPASMARGNRRLLVEFNNRGNKRALQFFNDAPHSNAPITLEHAGNGFFMRRGYAVAIPERPGHGRTGALTARKRNQPGPSRVRRPRGFVLRSRAGTSIVAPG